MARKKSTAASETDDGGAKSAGKRELNKQANREAILEAAQRVFLERGYESVTIRDVIRETDLASGTFYNYFRDKESLLNAMVEARIAAMTERVSTARRAARDAEQFLRGAYTTVFQEICDHPDFYAMMLRNEPVIRGMYGGSALGISLQTLKADLRDAIQRGLLPELDVDVLAAMLFGTGYELARLLVERKPRDPQQIADFVTRMFLAGLGGLAPNARLIRRGSITHQGSAR